MKGSPTQTLPAPAGAVFVTNACGFSTLLPWRKPPYIIADPMSTKLFSVETLKGWGMVGIYRLAPDA